MEREEEVCMKTVDVAPYKETAAYEVYLHTTSGVYEVLNNHTQAVRFSTPIAVLARAVCALLNDLEPWPHE